MPIDPKYKAIRSFEDDVIKRFDSTNRAQISGVKSFIYAELQKFTTGQDGKHIDSTSPANKKIIAGIRQRIASKVTGAAHTDPVNDLFKSYNKIIDYQKGIFDELGYDHVYDMAVTDLTRLETASKMPFTEIGGVRKVVTTEIRKAFNDALFGKATLNELSNTIDGKLSKLGSWGYTIASTGLMGFDRAVTDEMAKELGIDEFTYFKLKDKLNRPFCHALLSGKNPNTGEPHGEIWAREEIAKLKNGQKLDVMRYGGGYNCRHFWQPVPRRGSVKGKAKPQAKPSIGEGGAIEHSPHMSRNEANQWSKDSLWQGDVYHCTDSGSVEKIIKSGFNIGIAKTGRMEGDGVYLSSEVEKQYGAKVLSCKVNIANPYYSSVSSDKTAITSLSKLGKKILKYREKAAIERGKKEQAEHIREWHKTKGEIERGEGGWHVNPEDYKIEPKMEDFKPAFVGWGESVTMYLRSKGHDSIISRLSNNIDWVIVFDANNVTTYNVSDSETLAKEINK